MRGLSIKRAFRIIQMFNSGPVTVPLIMREFGIKRQSAKRWVDVASEVLPVYESGKICQRGKPPVTVYELLGG